MTAHYKLVLIRHGESKYNANNLFTGWHDADLSSRGKIEATHAGRLLEDHHYEFDIAFTSLLKRTIKTLYSIQEVFDCHWLPVIKSWRLNERHYGALQGLNKAESAETFGKDQVHEWRRSYDKRPPPMGKDDERWSGKGKQYSNMDQGMVPATESLQDCVERILPFWYDQIAPIIKTGQRVLIVSHANTIRGLVKYLDELSQEQLLNLNIPTGIPMVYELDENLRPVKHYFLASENEVAESIAKVASQAKLRNYES